jgi:hypothetical protein
MSLEDFSGYPTLNVVIAERGVIRVDPTLPWLPKLPQQVSVQPKKSFAQRVKTKTVHF